MILFEEEDEKMPEIARASDVQSFGNLFAFKVNVKNICADNAFMIVESNDEDVPSSPEMKMFPIRVQYNN